MKTPKLTQQKIEWKTLFLFVACYGLWLVTTYEFSNVSATWGIGAGCLMLFLATALAAAFHTSLQHEVVHGHPTSWSLVNEALVFPSLILVYPFRRYRRLHLKHHNDANLTDPYEDPESYFWPQNEKEKLGSAKLYLLGLNNTFLGRMILGPLLGLWGFYKTEIVRIRKNEKGVRKAWLLHFFGCAIVVFWLTVFCQIPMWMYVLTVVYPGISWILVRSFAEHKADTEVGKRTIIVEAHPFFGLLFLNNNLHVVHHAHPEAAWYDLPGIYQSRRAHFLALNGGYIFSGYGKIIRQFAFHRKQDVFHPIVHRKS
jgi:fatty acid desaturase